MSEAAQIKLLQKRHAEVVTLLERAEKLALDRNFVKAIRKLLEAAGIAEEMRDEWISSGRRWNESHPIAELTRNASDLVAATGDLIGDFAETHLR